MSGTARYDLDALPGYRVGSDGTVSRWVKRRKAWRFLKVTPEGNAYVMVGGRKTTLSVARLVLSAFGPPRPTLFRALRWRDPDPRNNRIENLRWAPANSQNVGDPKMREYGRRSGSGERSRVLSDEEAAWALDRLAAGLITDEVAELLDVHRAVIDRLIAGSYPHIPRPDGIKPIGERRLRGDDHPARRFEDDEEFESEDDEEPE
jgi:hypothetical protein